MSLDNLHQRIDKLLEEVYRKQPPVSQSPTFKLHLFTTSEQQRLQTFLDLLSLKPEIDDIASIDLETLTEEEFEQYGYWLHLQRALEREDLTSTQQYRCKLSMSRDQVIQAFLSLDLSFLPTNLNVPGPSIQEGHCIYHFNRTGYRNLVINHIQRNRITLDTIDNMHRWLAFAASRQVAV